MEINKKYQLIIQPAQTPIGTVSLPVELDIEESIFLPWEKEKFLKFLRQDHSLSPNSKLTFCVTDSTGVTYKCKTKKSVAELLKPIKKETNHA